LLFVRAKKNVQQKIVVFLIETDYKATRFQLRTLHRDF